jgi:uncharacterized membrane protein
MVLEERGHVSSGDENKYAIVKVGLEEEIKSNLKFKTHLKYGLITFVSISIGVAIILFSNSNVQSLIGAIFALILPVLDLFGIKSYIPSWKESLDKCEKQAKEKVEFRLSK